MERNFSEINGSILLIVPDSLRGHTATRAQATPAHHSKPEMQLPLLPPASSFFGIACQPAVCRVEVVGTRDRERNRFESSLDRTERNCARIDRIVVILTSKKKCAKIYPYWEM
jgi:hypothetical protein